MIYLNGKEIKVTIFPDKTSQVWKIDEGLLRQCSDDSRAEILWEFESESEIIHLAQLASLLKSPLTSDNMIDLFLDIPYFPYGRQDKDISNDTTFALHTFINILRDMGFHEVTTIDLHNPGFIRVIDKSINIINIDAMDFINFSINATNPNILCYPDEGASKRYEENNLNSCYFEKLRNQSSGHIEYMKIKKLIVRGWRDEGSFFIGKKALIIDDICDGGATFTMIASELKRLGISEIYLYVTHGIFSKGIQVLKDAGISRIFTRKGEIL